MLAHKILEIAPDATADDVRRAYYRLAFRHHPDRGGDPRKFIRICQAYRDQMELCQRRLSSPRSKCVYFTSPEDHLVSEPTDPVSEQQSPVDLVHLRRTRRSRFGSLVEIVHRFETAAVVVALLTVMAALLIAAGNGANAAMVQPWVVGGLLATAGILAVTVSGCAREKAWVLYTQVVLAITACAAFVGPWG